MPLNPMVLWTPHVIPNVVDQHVETNKSVYLYYKCVWWGGVGGGITTIT